MGFRWQLVLLLAMILGGCNLVLGIVELTGEDLGTGGSNGGAAPAGGAAGAPAGGGTLGGGGTGGCGNECSNRVEWAKGWGSTADDSGLRVAIASDGRMVAVGEMAGPIDFDDQRTGSIFVLGFNAAGELAFSVSFANCSSPSVAIGAQDKLIVAGSYTAAPSFMPSLTGTGAFVLSLDPFTGAVDQHVEFNGNVVATAVATDANGNIAVVGGFQGAVTFASWGERTSSGTGSDTFVAKLTSSLAAASGTWPRIAGSGGTLVNYATAVTFSGTDIVAVGRKAGTLVDFGNGSLPTGLGMFLARLTGNSGTAVFVEGARPDSLDRASTGSVALGGYATQDATFGGKTVTAGRGFLVSFDLDNLLNGQQGVQWVKDLVGVTDDPVAVAVGLDGDVFGAATFLVHAEVGAPGELSAEAIGGKDILLARLDGTTGSAEWAEPFGSSNDDSPRGIEVSSSIALTGAYRGAFDFGAFPLGHEGLSDIFVARLSL